MGAALTDQDPVLDEIVRRLIKFYQPERSTCSAPEPAVTSARIATTT